MFEDALEEAYKGFGQSAHMDVDELRLLYQGRPNIHIVFTDDGSVETTHDDLPECFVSYDIDDVIGKRVKSSEFYAYVIRPDMSRGQFVKNVKEYSRDQFMVDMEVLKGENYIPEDALMNIITKKGYNAYIRHDFERLWIVTRTVAELIGGSEWQEKWRDILMSLGYIGFHDPSTRGFGQPTTILLAYEDREDIDILPIQKHRVDPRKRVERRIEREKRGLVGARNRVAKRRSTKKRIF